MYSETVEMSGHIIDSLLLPKILDEIMKHEADFSAESGAKSTVDFPFCFTLFSKPVSIAMADRNGPLGVECAWHPSAWTN